MPDPRYIVDDMRAQLATIAEAGVPIDGDDALADLALTYAQMCQEINGRLRRCNEYLARGLRSEAVHLATCPPDVRHAAGALAFTGRVDWIRLCSSRRLPMPAPLLVESLGALEEAIGIELKLEPLLARHRVLAMAREPHTQRLMALRLLAISDSNSPCWETQIRELEALRLRQMRKEAKAAFRSRSLSDIDQLYRELTQTPWRSSVPEDLRKVLSRAASVLRLEGSQAELQELAQKLAEAVKSGDEVAGQAALSRWQELVNGRQLAAPDALLDKVRAATTWLTGEQRRHEVRQKLKTAQPILEAEEKAVSRRKAHMLLRNIAIVVAMAALIGVGLFRILGRLHR